MLTLGPGAQLTFRMCDIGSQHHGLMQWLASCISANGRTDLELHVHISTYRGEVTETIFAAMEKIPNVTMYIESLFWDAAVFCKTIEASLLENKPGRQPVKIVMRCDTAEMKQEDIDAIERGKAAMAAAGGEMQLCLDFAYEDD